MHRSPRNRSRISNTPLTTRYFERAEKDWASFKDNIASVIRSLMIVNGGGIAACIAFVSGSLSSDRFDRISQIRGLYDDIVIIASLFLIGLGLSLFAAFMAALSKYSWGTHWEEKGLNRDIKLSDLYARIGKTSDKVFLASVMLNLLNFFAVCYWIFHVVYLVSERFA